MKLLLRDQVDSRSMFSKALIVFIEFVPSRILNYKRRGLFFKRTAYNYNRTNVSRRLYLSQKLDVCCNMVAPPTARRSAVPWTSYARLEHIKVTCGCRATALEIIRCTKLLSLVIQVSCSPLANRAVSSHHCINSQWYFSSENTFNWSGWVVTIISVTGHRDLSRK